MRKALKGGVSMMNTAAANIFRKALALKPDGLEGILNNLDPEQTKLTELANRLTRRRRYLQDLSSALNSAPKEIEKTSILKMVQPLSETVNRIHAWLNKAKPGLDQLNSVVKHQNSLLQSAISEFVKNNLNLFKANSNTQQNRSLNFVRAIK
jgi:hypothetical protein